MIEVTRVAGLDSADVASLSFFGASRYADEARVTGAGVVLVTRALADRVAHVPARIIVGVPQEAMLTAVALLHRPAAFTPGVHSSATMADGVTIGDGVAIGPRAVLGSGVTVGARTQIGAGVVLGDGVSVGEDCILYPNVSVYAESQLGDRVLIQAGAVIGSDGFGYVFRDGAHQKVPHVGRCVLEADVEIGANTTIDRGSVGDTVIGAGTKIDNLVQIGHNVRMGRALSGDVAGRNFRVGAHWRWSDHRGPGRRGGPHDDRRRCTNCRTGRRVRQCACRRDVEWISGASASRVATHAGRSAASCRRSSKR